MRDLVTIGGRLALICVVAALALGLVNAVTEPAIQRVKELQLSQALETVSLGGTFGKFVKVKDKEKVVGFYPLTRTNGKGYILRLTGVGYGGDLDLLATYAASGEVLAVSLMDDQETPGLGKKAERPEYMKKYIGRGARNPVPVSKTQLPQEQADAISGATITFMGVGEALSAGSAFVHSFGGDS